MILYKLLKLWRGGLKLVEVGRGKLKWVEVRIFFFKCVEVGCGKLKWIEDGKLQLTREKNRPLISIILHPNKSN